jgi:hypothetical protein
VTVRPAGSQPGASQRAARRTNAGAVVASYLTERGGVDDAPEKDSRPAGYGIDYDLAAVPPLRGSACLAGAWSAAAPTTPAATVCARAAARTG